MKHGVGFSFDNEKEEWSLSIWEQDQEQTRLETCQGGFPSYYNGYHYQIPKIHKLEKSFEDKDFEHEVSNYYMLDDAKKLEEIGLESYEIKWLNYTEVIPNSRFDHIVTHFFIKVEG